MAKSVRSKIKRKHRAEFRRTIGAEAAQANMDTIQAKLRECVQKGTMNSLERLSSLFNSNEQNDGIGINETTTTSATLAADSAKTDIHEPPRAMDTSSSLGGKQKDPDKIPVGKRSNKKKIHMAGTAEAALARKIHKKMKRRGQIRPGVKAGRRTKKTRIKKEYRCAF